MKVTAYDPDYSLKLANGTTIGSSASNDLAGSITAPTVVGVQGTGISSNAPTAVGQVLTISQVSPPQALWATPSNTLAYGSNANDVGVSGASGAATAVSRADHVHRGVTTVAHASNAYTGTVTLAPGPNVAITSPAAGTFTISSTDTTGAAVSYGSNATDVGATTTGGTASSASRSDHYHRGVNAVAVGSNTLYGGVTLAPGAGAALTTVGNTVTVTAGNIAHSSNTYSGTVTLVAGPNVQITSPGPNRLAISSTDTSGAAISYGATAEDVAAAASGGVATTVSRSDHAHRGVTSLAVSSNTGYGALTLAPGPGIGLTTVGSTTTISGSTVSHTSNTSSLTTLLAGPGIAITSPGVGRLQFDGTTIAAGSNAIGGPISLVPATGAAITANTGTETITVHGTQVSHTSNTFSGNVTLLAGPNVAITSPGSNRLQIASTATGSGGGVTSVAAGSNAYTGAVVFGGGGVVGVVAPSANNISVVGPAFATGTTATVTDAPTVGTQHSVARGDHSHYGVYLVAHSSNAVAGQVTFAPGAGVAFTQPSAGQFNVTGTTVAHTSNTYGIGTTLVAGPGIAITTPGTSRFQIDGTRISHASNTLVGPINFVPGPGISFDASASTEVFTVRGTTLSHASNTYGGPVTIVPGSGLAITSPASNQYRIAARNESWEVEHYDNAASAVNTTITTAGTYYALTNHEVSFTPEYIGQRWLLTLTSYASLNTTTIQNALIRADVTTSANAQIVILGYTRSENFGTSGRGGTVAFTRVWNADRTTAVKFKLYGTVGTTNGLVLSMSYTQMEAIPLW